MKKIFCISLLLLIVLTSCNKKRSVKNSSSNLLSQDKISSSVSSEDSVKDFKSDKSSEIKKESCKTKKKLDVTKNTISEKKKSSRGNSKKNNSYIHSESKLNKGKKTESKITNNSSQIQVTNSQKTEIVYATEKDTEDIAGRIIEYINEYRNSGNICSAKKLTGLTRYAGYRSKQLITRFEHNTEDERKAANAVKYGEYVVPKSFGLTGEPYYISHTREAIAMSGYSGTVNDVARNIATLVKNSSPHWAYVGSDDYSFIGVGVTYCNGLWFASIAMSATNEYEN